jgi:arylsulfatase
MNVRTRRIRLVVAILACFSLLDPGSSASQGKPPVSGAGGAPRAKAPNVIVILTDDVGFAASSAFGGPIPTPTFDALAASGLRYNNFHTTALCSPTRAALLTGRNPHAVGMGTITEGASADPGYTSAIPRSAATIARVLRDHGYHTAAFGKYHLIPKWEMSAVGPFDHWPTSMGFDYFYGFEPAMTDQFTPALIENTRPIPAPARPGYFLEADLADRAIHWLREVRGAKRNQPFFMYYAPATAHAPVQAPGEWIARFRGRFDRGWDVERRETLARQKRLGIVPPDAVLTPRADGVPAWDSLRPDERRLAARYMEVYAAALSYADHQVGRLLAELRASGEYENTVIVYIQGDNGASPEGGVSGTFNYYDALNALNPRSSDGYAEKAVDALSRLDALGGPASAPAIPTGWANALSTPFPRWKGEASSLGAVRNGMVIAWPAGIRAQGQVRQQFHSITDIAPTIYDVVGIAAPASVDGVAQQAIDGVSMAYSFDAPTAPSARGQQYFETGATMAMYSDGWWASYRAERGEVLDAGLRTRAEWQLFDLREDFSQSRDVAKANPGKLQELKSLFGREAARNNVLPIRRGRGPRARAPVMQEPGRHVLYPGTERYSDWGFPGMRRRSWSVTARIQVPVDGGSGAIVNQGGRFAGWGLFLQGGVPNFIYRSSDAEASALRIRAPGALSPGPHVIKVVYTEDGSGVSATTGASALPADVELNVDGKAVAKARLVVSAPMAFMYQGGAIGQSTGSPLGAEYVGRFAFTGVIDSVEFDLGPAR